MTTRSFAAKWFLGMVAALGLVGVSVEAQRLDRLVARNVSIRQITFKGRPAIQVIGGAGVANGTSYALVEDVTFRDGVIEVEVAGQPAAGASSDARGFIGIAFRMQADGRYEVHLSPADERPRRRPDPAKSCLAIQRVS